MIEKIKVLRKMAKELNTMEYMVQPYKRKFINITKFYFKENMITEISINDFSVLTGLKKDIAKTILIEINLELFNIKNSNK